MRSFPWPIAALLVVSSCGGSDEPMAAPFGLDQRPSNPTCLARPRPVVNTGVTLQRQWSTLTFSEPLFLLQAPGDSNQWFVVQREGKVRAFAGDATADSQVRDFATVTDSRRMPPVAVSITDPLGTKLIDDWIGSLTACP